MGKFPFGAPHQNSGTLIRALAPYHAIRSAPQLVLETGPENITTSKGADDLDSDALRGYIWDYADENFCVVPSAPFPFHLPILRDAFA